MELVACGTISTAGTPWWITQVKGILLLFCWEKLCYGLCYETVIRMALGCATVSDRKLVCWRLGGERMYRCTLKTKHVYLKFNLLVFLMYRVIGLSRGGGGGSHSQFPRAWYGKLSEFFTSHIWSGRFSAVYSSLFPSPIPKDFYIQ